MGITAHRGSFVASLVTIASLAACTDEDAYTVDIVSDPTKLAFVVSQDGDGVWRPVTLDASGAGSFEVTHGLHGVAHACWSTGQTVAALRILYSAGAPAQPLALCTSNTVARVTVEGVVTPVSAEVYAGPNGLDGNLLGDGTYGVSVRQGPAEVVAVAGPRMAIARLDLSADTTHDFDLAVDGFDLPAAPPTVDGTGGATVRVSSELHTTHGTYVYMEAIGGAARIVPVAQRAAGDRVVVAAELATDDLHQVDQQLVTGDALPALTIPTAPRLELDRTGVRWDGAWTWASASISRGGLANRFAESIGADAAWMSAHGDLALAWIDPTTLPGWDVAWPRFLPGETLRWSGAVERGDRAGDFAMTWRDAMLAW